jgi:hypothetical protein
MSTRYYTYCDICRNDITSKNESFDQFEFDIAWPKGHILVQIQSGDICKKCATDIFRKHFTGELLRRVLKSTEIGQPIPLQ